MSDRPGDVPVVTSVPARPRAPASPARLGGATLEQVFDPRRNALWSLRLSLAGLVAVAHAFGIGYGHQPAVGHAELAYLAVDGFFVLSGFLVTRSLVRTDSLRRYAWHRFLRLMPGFWVCLAVTAVIAAPLGAVVTGRDPLSVFTATEEPAWRYVLANSGLFILQYPIAGLESVAGDPEPFNGSLWTLRYEALCYGAVAVLGAVGVLARRRWTVLALIGLVWVVLVAEGAGAIPVDVPGFENRDLLRLGLLFLLGSAGYRFADRLPVRWAWALASLAVLVTAWLLAPGYGAWTGPAFAYLVLYAAVRLPVRADPGWDISYGLYLYHWPVQTVMLLAGWTALGEWPFVAVTVAVALGAATLSWVFVEGPALRAKGARWVDRSTEARRRA